MRSRTLAALLLSAACLPAKAQDDTPPTWSLIASISDQELVGEWELSQLSTGAPADEVFSSAAVAQFGVSKGSSFQIHVKLVNPQGVSQDITGSSKLMYRPTGCLSIDGNGQATVPMITAAPWTCNQGESIPLTIIYADKPADVAAVNMYLLKIN